MYNGDLEVIQVMVVELLLFLFAFTKQCFNGHVTTKRGGDSANGNNYVDNLTTTNMWTVCDDGGGYWIAIGY